MSSMWKNVIPRTSRCLRMYSSAGEKLVDTQVNDKTGVATVTLQRPPVNSLNLELLTAFHETMEKLEKNKCRGMILTSASPTVFSAGLDILEMYKPQQERLVQFWTKLQDTWLKLYSSPYPTVAAINGHSPAGGCLLATSCEYRVMVGGKYTIGLNETRLGIVAPRWFMDSMRNVISSRLAEVALTTGKLFTVDEAHKYGLIDEVASDKNDAIAKAEAWLENFENISPAARGRTKQAFRADTIQWLIQNKEKDLNDFVRFTALPQVQKTLEFYMEALKKK